MLNGAESRGGPPPDIIHTALNARYLANLDCTSKGVRALTGIQTNTPSADGELLDALEEGSLTENVAFLLKGAGQCCVLDAGVPIMLLTQSV